MSLGVNTPPAFDPSDAFGFDPDAYPMPVQADFGIDLLTSGEVGGLNIIIKSTGYATWMNLLIVEQYDSAAWPPPQAFYQSRITAALLGDRTSHPLDIFSVREYSIVAGTVRVIHARTKPYLTKRAGPFEYDLTLGWFVSGAINGPVDIAPYVAPTIYNARVTLNQHIARDEFSIPGGV